MSFARIALIGFGEVGRILAAELKDRAALSAYDPLFADPASAPSKGLAAGIRAGASAAEAVREADLVISAVTAAQDVAAAEAAAKGLKTGAIFLDFNSASPGNKKAAAAAVEAAGGRYVEAAVMSPFPPKRLATPMLLGGPHAEATQPALAALGFTDTRVFSPEVGPAAAAKLCRSVMVKGIEALLTESMLSARVYGVEETVLASLSDLFPLPDWRATAGYMVSRSLEHGARRAEEMREAARTVEEAGVASLMSAAIAERQAWAAHYAEAAQPDALLPMLDAVLKDLR